MKTPPGELELDNTIEKKKLFPTDMNLGLATKFSINHVLETSFSIDTQLPTLAPSSSKCQCFNFNYIKETFICHIESLLEINVKQECWATTTSITTLYLHSSSTTIVRMGHLTKEVKSDNKYEMYLLSMSVPGVSRSCHRCKVYR
jgi:hypothetical protein